MDGDLCYKQGFWLEASFATHILTLSFAGVKFSAAGELAEGPFAALGRARGGSGCACRSGNRGLRSPVCGRGMNAPHIARFVERDAYHPPLASATQRHAVCDAGGH